MSSFRIERQYVSFKTVETPNVHPVEQTSQGRRNGGAFDPEGDGNSPTPKEGYGAEIIENARREAEKRADQILRWAEKEAEGITDAAKTEAGGILAKAKESAEGIRAAARAEGYELGGKRAEAEAAVRKSDEAQELEQMVQKLKSDYCGILDDMQQDVKALVVEITRKIINVKLKESDDVFLGLINDAVDRLKQARCLVIRVCPENYARYFGTESPEHAVNAGQAKVVVTEEDTFSPGDLIVESEGEMLNLSIDRQLGKIEAALFE
jgi:flagellar biosynthesis/type III secretory pathway protein FliH